MSLEKLMKEYDFSEFDNIYDDGSILYPEPYKIEGLIMKDRNNWEGIYELMQDQHMFPQMPITFFPEYMVYEMLFRQVYLSALLKQKRLIFTNISISREKLIELSNLSRGYLRIVCLRTMDVDVYHQQRKSFVGDILELIKINKESDYWFSYNSGYQYYNNLGIPRSKKRATLGNSAGLRLVRYEPK